MNTSTTGFSLPRWAVMWGIAFALYGMLKALTWVRRKPSAAPAWKQALYLFGWPGMDADTFFNAQPSHRATLAEWATAIFKFACGLAVLLVLVRMPGGSDYFVGFLGMLGVIVTLHFGLFHVLSCAYRQFGIAAVPIMNRPFESRSLAEFWGQRWNLAFRDLTYRHLFRPLASVVGSAGALMVAFLFSGLAHDAVISIPAGAGYGLPTCYFLIQAIAILVEHSRWGRAIGLGQGMQGWLFCLVVALAPIPLLFHEPFICRVIFPFLQAMGAVQ